MLPFGVRYDIKRYRFYIRGKMSTSIRGFILDEGTDLFSLSRKVRTIFLPKVQQNIYRELLEKLFNAYDMATYSPATLKDFRNEHDMETGQINFHHIWMIAQKQQRNDMTEIPSMYQVKLSFAADPETGKILCVWSGKGENYELFLKEFPEAKDYSYWDSHNHPLSVTNDEWIERGKAWDRSLLPSGNVSASCLVSVVAAPHELSSNVSLLEMEKVGTKIPDHKWRIENLSGYFITHQWLNSEKNPLGNFSGLTAALSDSENISLWNKVISEDISSDVLGFSELQEFLDKRKVITE